MPPRNLLMRIGALLVLGLGWWWLSAAHWPWIAAVRDRIHNRPSSYDGTAAIAAAVTLTIFLGACLWARFNPRRRRSYDATMGEGCAVMIAIGLAGLGVLLAIGWFARVPLIIWAVAAITVLPAIQIAIALVYEGIKSLRKRRERRGRQISGEELTKSLAGKTHVIRRISSDEPPRRWRELRFYAPDGRMAGYAEEEDGRINAYPVKVIWRVEGEQLVTVSSLEPEKPHRYTIRVGPDGQLIYHQFEPGSPIHGQVLFRTMEIRSIEPTPRDAPATPAVPAGTQPD